MAWATSWSMTLSSNGGKRSSLTYIVLSRLSVTASFAPPVRSMSEGSPAETRATLHTSPFMTNGYTLHLLGNLAKLHLELLLLLRVGGLKHLTCHLLDFLHHVIVTIAPHPTVATTRRITAHGVARLTAIATTVPTATLPVALTTALIVATTATALVAVAALLVAIATSANLTTTVVAVAIVVAHLTVLHRVGDALEVVSLGTKLLGLHAVLLGLGEVLDVVDDHRVHSTTLMHVLLGLHEHFVLDGANLVNQCSALPRQCVRR